MSFQEEEEAAEPVKQEKTLFTVKMVKFDEAKKVAVIKEVKSLVAGMNLVQVILWIFYYRISGTIKYDGVALLKSAWNVAHNLHAFLILSVVIV